VVSCRRANAGLGLFSSTGDYATPNSNHIRDGTRLNVEGLSPRRVDALAKLPASTTSNKYRNPISSITNASARS